MKNINSYDKNQASSGIGAINNNLDLGSITTYKELNDSQLKKIVELLIELDQKFNLYNLEDIKLQSNYFDKIISEKNEKLNKHLKQIAQIVGHVKSLVNYVDKKVESTCLVELGAGRGKLSYWFEQARLSEESSELDAMKFNILLIEVF